MAAMPYVPEPGSGGAQPPRKRTGLVLAGVAAALALMVIVAVVGIVVVRNNGSDTPKVSEAEQLLTKARQYVAARQSVTWKFSEQAQVAVGSKNVNTSATGSLESVLAASLRTLKRTGGTTIETVVVGEDAWTRAAADADIEGTPWRSLDIPRAANPARLLADMLVRTRSPKIDSRSGDTVVLRVEASAYEYFFAQAGGQLSTRELLITMSPTGAVKALGARGTATGITYSYDTNDLVWDSPVEITAPQPAQIDQTPNTDEEVLKSFTDATVLVPAEIYQGWSLRDAQVLPAPATEEQCRQASVRFSNPENGGFTETFSLPVSCASIRPADAQDITVNGNSGWIGTKDGDTFAEIIVGNTRYQVRTNLKRDQLVPLLENLVPFDPQKPPPATKIPGRTS
ncbi:MAG: hypothetical protein ACOYNI_04960 [Acidimicrobiia bacterium]